MTIGTEMEYHTEKHQVLCSIYLKKDNSLFRLIDTEKNNERNFRKATIDLKNSVKKIDNNEALFVILNFHIPSCRFNFEPCIRSQEPIPDIYRVMYFLNILKEYDERYSCTNLK
jgi:hypothetical protein